MIDDINQAVAAERERCADIAVRCARGAAIEYKGEIHVLGVMMKGPAEAQYATAMAIFEAIEAGGAE